MTFVNIEGETKVGRSAAGLISGFEHAAPTVGQRVRNVWNVRLAKGRKRLIHLVGEVATISRAAASMTSATILCCVRKTAWLAFTFVTRAPILLAMASSIR